MAYKEMLAEYGEKKVIFRSYYKYSFVFAGEGDLEVIVGGNPDDIYRLSVEPNKKYTVAELEPRSVYIGDKCIYSGW